MRCVRFSDLEVRSVDVWRGPHCQGDSDIHPVLAGIGCISLAIYILACSTSFSPDDSRVLYLAFDPDSGAQSVAVYDRENGSSETVFAALGPREANGDPDIFRAQWLPDGKHVLVASAGKGNGVEFFVIPYHINEPLRHFVLSNMKVPPSFVYPFVVIGSQLFFSGPDKSVERMDLMTGETTTRELSNETMVLPDPDGKTIVGFQPTEDDPDRAELGSIDPQTLQFKPAVVLVSKVSEGTFPAFNPRKGQIAVISALGERRELQIFENGGLKFTRALTRGDEKLAVGPFLDITPGGDRVLTMYRRLLGEETNAEYGLLEIPLNDVDPLRFTPLFRMKPKSDEELMLAQPSLSHDGRTWAVATTNLCLDNEALKPEDCALYLVDVRKSVRPVNKVAIKPPPRRGAEEK